MLQSPLQRAIALAKASNNTEMLSLLNLVKQDYYFGAAEINALVGNHFNGGWPAIDKQIDIIESEFNETKDDGVGARNVHELRDGVCDLVFTTLGMSHRAGVHSAADYEKVVASQFSKFDPTEEDAIKTQAKYQALNMVTNYEQRQIPGTDEWVYVTFSAADQIDGEGRKCGKGKWLKSYRFQEPTFDQLPEHVATKLAVEPVPA